KCRMRTCAARHPARYREPTGSVLTRPICGAIIAARAVMGLIRPHQGVNLVRALSQERSEVLLRHVDQAFDRKLVRGPACTGERLARLLPGLDARDLLGDAWLGRFGNSRRTIAIRFCLGGPSGIASGRSGLLVAEVLRH